MYYIVLMWCEGPFPFVAHSNTGAVGKNECVRVYISEAQEGKRIALEGIEGMQTEVGRQIDCWRGLQYCFEEGGEDR